MDLAQAPARVFFVPDKSCSIAWLGNGEAMGFSKGGEGVLFTMLMNLRGRLGRRETVMPVPYGGHPSAHHTSRVIVGQAIGLVAGIVRLILIFFAMMKFQHRDRWFFPGDDVERVSVVERADLRSTACLACGYFFETGGRHRHPNYATQP